MSDITTLKLANNENLTVFSPEMSADEFFLFILQRSTADLMNLDIDEDIELSGEALQDPTVQAVQQSIRSTQVSFKDFRRKAMAIDQWRNRYSQRFADQAAVNGEEAEV